MANFTLIELHLDDATLSSNLDIGGDDETETATDGDDQTDDGAGAPDETEEDGGGKVAALLGTLALLALVAAAVRYLSGDDEAPDVEIETADDGPVGVTVDADDE